MSNLTKHTLKDFNAMIRSDNTLSYLNNVLKDKSNSFIANLTVLVSNNINLQFCEPYSVMFAALKATVLDLPLDSNLGFAYVIPYNDKHRGQVAQFQIGYKGFLQLAIRSGQFTKINVTEIKDGEIEGFDIVCGDVILKKDFKPDYIQNQRCKLPTVGYYAYFKLVNGFEKSVYWSLDKIIEHAKKYSKSFNNAYGVYKTNPNEMYAKTVLKNLLSKWAPLSIQMSDAIKYDQAVINNDVPYYVDNPAFEDNTEGNDKAVDLLAKALSGDITVEEAKQLNKELDGEIKN